jgi:hypothetical protein
LSTPVLDVVAICEGDTDERSASAGGLAVRPCARTRAEEKLTNCCHTIKKGETHRPPRETNPEWFSARGACNTALLKGPDSASFSSHYSV